MSDPDHPAWQTIRSGLAGQGDALAAVERLFESASSEELERLLEEVDGSDYSLRDWADALGNFETWLVAHRIDARPLGEILGYIHCCTLMNAPGIPLPSLEVRVAQSLAEFGFDATARSQI